MLPTASHRNRILRPLATAAALAVAMSACGSADNAGPVAATPDAVAMTDSTTTPAASPSSTNPSTPTTTMPATTTPTTTTPTTTTPATTAPTTVPTTSVAPPTTAAPPTTTAPAPNSCSTTHYTVQYPADWHSSTTWSPCGLFSPAPVTLVSEAEFQLEISLYASTTPYADILNTVLTGTGHTIISDAATTVDGQSARVIELLTNGVDQPGPAHNRYIYLVDLGTGTLQATASEYLDQSQASPDYPGSKVALDQMMSTIDVVVGAVNQKTANPCTGNPAVNGPTVASTAGSFDLDGDGTFDSVELIDNPATNGGWIRAILSGGGFIDGTIDYLDTVGAPAALSVSLADLDLANGGLPEAIFLQGFGASGSFHSVMYIDGCDWKVPAADATHGRPELVNAASAAMSTSWGCEFGAHGEVEITTATRTYTADPATPSSWVDQYWQFDAGDWLMVGQAGSATNPGGPVPVTGSCPLI